MTSKTVIIILASLFLISCTASQHAGTFTVTRPALTETDEAIWFGYFQDRFDCYAGEVEPLGPGVPEPIRQGYERAKREWKAKDANATLRTFMMCVPVGVALGVLLTR